MPGYKQTEVGKIPEDWSVEFVGKLGAVIRGASPRPKGDRRFYGGPVPRLMVEDVSRDRKFVTPIVDSLTLEGEMLSRPCKRGTLTFVCSGDVGIPSFLAVDACIHDGFLALIAISEDCHDDYLYHYIGAHRDRLDSAGTHGGVFKNLTTDVLRAFPIAVPSKPEQKAIAEALSDVDELISGLEALIAKKRALKSAAMQQLLTGKTRLPGFGRGAKMVQTEFGEIPSDWEVKALGSVMRIRHGKSQKEVVSENGLFPILATGGEIGRANRPIYSKPSVLIGRKGTIDEPVYMDSPFWTVDTLFYSEIDPGADAKFIYYKLCMIDWYKYNEASGVPSLNSATIEKVRQTFPPTLEEQTAISKTITDIDNDIECGVAHLKKAQALKQGMMQELLTGRTRLI